MIRLLVAASFASALVVGAAAAATPDPSGNWVRSDGNAKVRIAKCGKNICATNTWIKDTSGGEEVGDVLVMTLKQKSGNTLAGKAYDKKRDLTYTITVKVGKGTLSTRGCIIGGVICKNVSWTAGK